MRANKEYRLQMTEEAKEIIDSMRYNQIDPEDRSFENLYKILNLADVDELKDESKFASFFTEFKYLIDK